MTLPPCPDWNEDRPRDVPTIIANIKDLWPAIEADATARPAPSLAIAVDWHRRIYDRVPAPHPEYVGQVRGLPPFVRIKPRPDDVPFAGAAEMSMRGDHRPTEAMFASMLDDALRAATGQS